MHPYKEGNGGSHGHFLETDLYYPPFSLPARPFAWTMLHRNVAGVDKTIFDIAAKYGIDYKEEREPNLLFQTNWVQDATNQREIFRVFYQDVKINESLVIPYTKQVPFIDDSRRVVMGIGFVTSVTGRPRGDTELSKWYTGDAEHLDDNIFIELQRGSLGKHVSFKLWSTPEELEERIFETVYEETEMQDVDDIEGFDLSLGGHINSGWMNFASSEDEIKKIEGWQILSAYRNDAAIGTATINRYIHEKYRLQESMKLTDCQIRSTRNLLGTDGIVYGDKVINVRNQHKDGYNAVKGRKEEGYVANGEVGIVERIWEKPKARENTHQIVFSSQPDMNYNWLSTISDEGNSDLELAYAILDQAKREQEKRSLMLTGVFSRRSLSQKMHLRRITMTMGCRL